MSSITYTITIPNAEDFGRLLHLWENSVRATHHFLSEEKILFFKSTIIEQQLFQKSDIFCTRNISGEIVGFAGVAGDSLDMLFLDPAVIGTGAGKALILYAINVKRISKVDVNEQNSKARGFYEHFGFKVASRTETDDQGEAFPLLHMVLSKDLLVNKPNISDLSS